MVHVKAEHVWPTPMKQAEVGGVGSIHLGGGRGGGRRRGDRRCEGGLKLDDRPQFLLGLAKYGLAAKN